MMGIFAHESFCIGFVLSTFSLNSFVRMPIWHVNNIYPYFKVKHSGTLNKNIETSLIDFELL